MPNLTPSTIEHSATVAAPAEVIFDLVADLERWPQFFQPAVHAECLWQGEGEDVVRRWAIAGNDTVRTWNSRRHLDRGGLRITFEQVNPEPPVALMRGEWVFKQVAAESTLVEVRHEFAVVDDCARDRQRTGAQLDSRGAAQLAAVKETAERRADLDQLVLSFEDPLFIAGRIQDAYEMLYEADKWPERIAHVRRLELTEETPNIQFFDMDTETPDGSAHTTRSVRICLPPTKIIYKQIMLPKLLDAHTGHWLFSQTAEGVVASARHTVTIKPSALPILGPGTTVPDARRYLRDVLSANSMKNLRLAKEFAEERARG